MSLADVKKHSRGLDAQAKELWIGKNFDGKTMLTIADVFKGTLTNYNFYKNSQLPSEGTTKEYYGMNGAIRQRLLEESFGDNLGNTEIWKTTTYLNEPLLIFVDIDAGETKEYVLYNKSVLPKTDYGMGETNMLTEDYLEEQGGMKQLKILGDIFQ